MLTIKSSTKTITIIEIHANNSQLPETWHRSMTLVIPRYAVLVPAQLVMEELLGKYAIFFT